MSLLVAAWHINTSLAAYLSCPGTIALHITLHHNNLINPLHQFHTLGVNAWNNLYHITDKQLIIEKEANNILSMLRKLLLQQGREYHLTLIIVNVVSTWVQSFSELCSNLLEANGTLHSAKQSWMSRGLFWEHELLRCSRYKILLSIKPVTSCALDCGWVSSLNYVLEQWAVLLQWHTWDCL